MPQTLGDLLHSHVAESEFTKGSTRLNEVEGDLDHRVTRKAKRNDGVGMLMQHNGNRPQTTTREIHEVEGVERGLFFL